MKIQKDGFETSGSSPTNSAVLPEAAPDDENSTPDGKDNADDRTNEKI